MKLVNQYVPFVNARLQAKVNLFGRLNPHDPRTAAHTAGKAILWAIMPSVSAYLYNMHFHRDVWKEIPGYVKDNYDVVILGWKRDEKGRRVPDYLKITKGDVEQMFVNPIINFLGYVEQKDPKALAKVTMDWFSEISPVPFAREGQLSMSRLLAGGVPPIFRTPIEVVEGKSLFTGREIVPYELQKLKASEQYNETTPELYKSIGKAINVSPMKAQAFSRGLLGSMAAYPSPKGIAKTLSGRIRSTTGGESLARAYKLQKQAEEGYFTARHKIEKAYNDRKMNEAAKYQHEWDVDFINILRKMQAITGQSMADLYRSPFYKMYSFQEKDLRAIQKGTSPEQIKKGWLSGLEEKLGHNFYSRD
jgi:hypothetical protein